MSAYQKAIKKKRDHIKKVGKNDQNFNSFIAGQSLKIETNSSDQLQLRGFKGYESLIFKENLGIGTHYSSIKVLKPHQTILNGNIIVSPAFRFGVVNSLLNKKVNKILSLGSNEGTYSIKSINQNLSTLDKRFMKEKDFESTENLEKENITIGDVVSIILKIDDLKNPKLLKNLIVKTKNLSNKSKKIKTHEKYDQGLSMHENENMLLLENSQAFMKSGDTELDCGQLENEEDENNFLLYGKSHLDEYWINKKAKLDFYINGV